jgi:hypothetical protein
MALIVGKQGRPTAGVTWNSNSLCALIRGASKNRLALERLYIAPHAPNFTVTHPVNIAAVRAFEEPMRRLWCQTRAVSELAPMMFEGYPGFRPDSVARPVLEERTLHLSEMPAVDSPDDWRALNTRLRLVMEDPRQLLSSCVTDYAVEQLQANGNNPASVRVPGLDNMHYR